MKKIILALAAAFIGIVSYTASAQNVIEKGTNIMNLGVGLNNNRALTIVGNWDYGMVGNLWDANSAFTLGVQGSFTSGDNYGIFTIGPAAGLHYHFVPQLDTYLRLMLGYSIASVNDNGPSNIGSGFGWDLTVGARYMFNPNIGAFIEAGYGVSIARVGVAFKF